LKHILFALADGDDSQSASFDTQFFYDHYDDGDSLGFDDGDDGGGIGSAASAVPGAEGDESDLMATLERSSRRIGPKFVNYTKRAKRVDVRKSKENIWKGLDIKTPNPKDPDESMVRILDFSGLSFVPHNRVT
jgi:condensin complex subunit 2